MFDPYRRPIKSLRISVTRKCNLNCIYCHEEGELHSARPYEISVPEITKIARLCYNEGVTKVKFSGGEPLLRKDIREIIEALPPFEDISMTTNGQLLAERISDVEGLDRINVSMDTLNAATYKKLTGGKIENVLSGIDAALEADLTPVKINMVVMDGINDHEIGDMIRFVQGKEMVLQLIELMDFKNGSELRGSNLSLIESTLEGLSNRTTANTLHNRKKFEINNAEIEIVRPIDNTEFCMNCNRLRVTSDAKLKPCLLRNDNLVDVRGIDNLSDERALELIMRAITRREPYYKPRFLGGAYSRRKADTY
ncbi:MAG: GTP 3',8-cyclase MoaA [Halobacteriota archaeon]